MNNRETGNRIKRAREAAGMTQAEAADVLGIRQPSYFRIEQRGTSQHDHLVELARLYRVSVNWLIYGIEDIKSQDRNSSGFIKNTSRQIDSYAVGVNSQQSKVARRSLLHAPDVQAQYGPEEIPVYATFANSDGSYDMVTGDQTGNVSKHPDQQGIKTDLCYAIHMVGNAMSPIYVDGQRIYGARQQPFVPGNHVILRFKDQLLSVRELIAVDYGRQTLTCRHYHPEIANETISMEGLEVDLVVGSGIRR